MNLFEKMSEEVLSEELLNEISIDSLMFALKSPERIEAYATAIKKGELFKAGPRRIEDKNKRKMSTEEVIAFLKKSKDFQAAKAADIGGNINVILNYYLPNLGAAS